MLEQDRYKQSPKLYIFGMIILMFFWIFTLLGLYIVPYLIWEFHYDVPETIIIWQLFLQDEYELSSGAANWITFLTFAVPALACMIVSKMISNHIDKRIINESELAERTSVSISEGPHKEPLSSRPIGQEMSFATKIFLLMLVALVILFGIQWLISVPTPAI